MGFLQTTCKAENELNNVYFTGNCLHYTTMVVQPWYGWAWVSNLINTPFLEITTNPAYKFHCIRWGWNNTSRTHEPSVGDGTQHILCGGSPKSLKTFPEDRIRPANETEKKKRSINLNLKNNFLNKKIIPKNIFKLSVGKQRLQRRNNQCEIRTNLKAPEKTKDPKQKQKKYAFQKCWLFFLCAEL